MGGDRLPPALATWPAGGNPAAAALPPLPPLPEPDASSIDEVADFIRSEIGPKTLAAISLIVVLLACAAVSSGLPCYHAWAAKHGHPPSLAAVLLVALLLPCRHTPAGAACAVQR